MKNKPTKTTITKGTATASATAAAAANVSDGAVASIEDYGKGFDDASAADAAVPP